ncbi:MAG TPA: Crp/Fnr family transcriptional regulator [Chitinophagaceae bacterium]
MVESLEIVFPSFERALVDEIISKGGLRSYAADEPLLRTGQYFRSALLVVQGLIKVYREDENGAEFFMYYLQPGQACALSMVCAAKNEQSKIVARAVSESTVITIPLEYTDRWMQEYRSWHVFVVETYRRMIDGLLLTIDDIAFRNMDARLAHYLEREIEIHHSDILLVNHTAVAEELNSSREVISRLMKKLSDRGAIRLLKNQMVEIIDLKMMQKESC